MRAAVLAPIAFLLTLALPAPAAFAQLCPACGTQRPFYTRDGMIDAYCYQQCADLTLQDALNDAARERRIGPSGESVGAPNVVWFRDEIAYELSDTLCFVEPNNPARDPNDPNQAIVKGSRIALLGENPNVVIRWVAADGANKPMIDMSAARYCMLSNLTLEAPSATPAYCAVLLQRAGPSAPCPSAAVHRFSGVTMTGAFAKSAFISLSAEASYYEDCVFQNDYDGAVNCLYTANDDSQLEYSTRCDSTPCSSTNQQNSFYRCVFRLSHAGTVAATAAAIHFDIQGTTTDWFFEECSVELAAASEPSEPSAAILFSTDFDSATTGNFVFSNCQIDASAVHHGVYMTSTERDPNNGLRGVHYKDITELHVEYCTIKSQRSTFVLPHMPGTTIANSKLRGTTSNWSINDPNDPNDCYGFPIRPVLVASRAAGGIYDLTGAINDPNSQFNTSVYITPVAGEADGISRWLRVLVDDLSTVIFNRITGEGFAHEKNEYIEAGVPVDCGAPKPGDFDFDQSGPCGD